MEFIKFGEYIGWRNLGKGFKRIWDKVEVRLCGRVEYIQGFFYLVEGR